MGDKEFWDLIDHANASAEHREDREDTLEASLHTLGPAGIEAFYLCYDRAVTRAWTTKLACAAYLINCYDFAILEEQDFLWFTCWLIDRGKVVYEAALLDPDSLADIEEELPWGSDGYWDRAMIAWQIATGGSELGFGYRLDELGASGPVDLPTGGGTSKRYLKKHHPRLFRRYAEEMD